MDNRKVPGEPGPQPGGLADELERLAPLVRQLERLDPAARVFTMGDLVESLHYDSMGQIGVVRALSGPLVGVQFARWSNGHDLDGLLSGSLSGWWCHPTTLRRYV